MLNCWVCRSGRFIHTFPSFFYKQNTPSGGIRSFLIVYFLKRILYYYIELIGFFKFHWHGVMQILQMAVFCFNTSTGVKVKRKIKPAKNTTMKNDCEASSSKDKESESKEENQSEPAMPASSAQWIKNKQMGDGTTFNWRRLCGLVCWGKKAGFGKEALTSLFFFSWKEEFVGSPMQIIRWVWVPLVLF